ncbi:MAG TPA: pyruvate kinase, partial [Stellaceae bacterium]|nr:pyruvate kinase [Stellaceae bacterium]
MRRQRSAKIVATLGPASATPDKIAALFEAGVDVFRLNFSHGEQAEHRARLDAIRALEKKTGRPIGVMADLQGPKLRVGTFAGGKVNLVPGAGFRLDLDKTPGNASRANLPHPEIFAAIAPGTELLLDDGNIRLKVEKSGKDFAETKVMAGGELSDRKGVNVPNAMLAVSALTPKDRSDLDFALKIGVDWVALSFVQRPEDVAEARKLIGGRAGILVKLEKPAAIGKLDEIIELSEAVMV